MRLFRYELHKSLISEKGILLLILCLLLETTVLLWLPEQIDDRIRISRKQYDRLLLQYEGESSAEKETEILERRAETLAVLNAYEDELEAWNSGERTEAEWQEFSDRFKEASLIRNAIEIFAEKAEAFLLQEGGRKSWFFDDRGWNTIFLFLKYPNVFLLVFVVYISLRSGQYETENGTLPMILVSKRAWPEVFLTKTMVVVLLSVTAVLLFSFEEYLVFSFRGFLAEGRVPIGSIPCFYEYASDLSLAEAYCCAMLFRAIAVVLVSTAAYGTGILIQRFLYSAAVSVIVLVVPYVSRAVLGEGFLFTWTCWLSGVDLLRLLSSAAGGMIALSGCMVAAISIALLMLSVKKYKCL